MKKIALYLTTLFVIHFASASQLNLQFTQYGIYNIILNGAVYNTQSDFINITHVGAGNHHLKIVKTIVTQYGISFQEVVYNSTISIPFRSTVYGTLYGAYNLQINNKPFIKSIIIIAFICRIR